MSLSTENKITQQNWFRTWQEVFGFPADYVALDLVTTGKNLDDDLILAIDLCQVQIVAQNPLGERCQASIAVANGRRFVRTEGNLCCIRKGD